MKNLNNINKNKNIDLSNNKFFYYDRINRIKKNPLLLSNKPFFDYYNKNKLKPIDHNKYRYKMSYKDRYNYPYNITKALDTLSYQDYNEKKTG